MVKPQSGFSTPPIKEEKYFVRFVFDHFMVSWATSINAHWKCCLLFRGFLFKEKLIALKNFFERSNAKIPDFPRMKFTPLAKGQSLYYATSSNFQLRQNSKKQTSKYRERSLCITRNIPQQNKMVKPQSGFSSTPPIKEETYFVRFVLTILWCHFCDLLQ